MILKCFDGPMDGAVYALSRETSDPQQRSTNRKPDGLWFDGVDEHGRQVQHQYAWDSHNDTGAGNHVTLCYRYTGPVVDTGLTLETEAHVVGTREREPEKPSTAFEHFISVVLCAKKQNTPEFMSYLADEINKAMTAVNCEDRVKWPGNWASEFQLLSGG